MKTDPLFYRLFKELPSSFFELIGRPATEANAYQFDSVEIKQTAFRIDGLFIPIEKNLKQPIYFAEVQFYQDSKIYANLFAEVFLYLNKNDPAQNWRAVVVYKERSLEPTELEAYQELLNSQKVIRVYLDELDLETARTVGIGIVQLVMIEEGKTAEKAKQLLEQARLEVTDEQIQQDVINLIETVVLYKFPQMSREELEAMLDLDDLKKTKFAQEMLAEGKLEAKLETVPALLQRGFSIEAVAEILKLEVEQVRQAIEQ